MLRSFFIFVVLISSFAIPVFAQTPATDSLTVEKALISYRLSNPVLSADGKKCAFVVSQPATLNKPGANHIWLLDLRDSSTRQYTNSDKAESNPKWSPKGGKLAFLSNRGGENQVYLLDDNGGEAMPLTTSKTGVTDFEWAPDGQHIAYTERDSVTTEEKKRKDDKYDEVVMSKNDKAVILFTIDLATKVARRQPGRNWKIADFKYLPSGDAMLLEIEELPSKEIPLRRLVKLDIKTGSYSDMPSPKHPSWGSVEIAPGGQSFAYTGARLDGPVSHDLFLQSFGGGEARNITGKTIDLPVRNCKFLSDDVLIGMVQHGMHSSLYKIPVNGKAAELGIGQNVLAYDITADHIVVFVSGAAAKLSELWLYTEGHTAVQLTHLNKAFDRLGLVTPEIVSYKSFDGQMIESLFLKPVKGVGPLPMVVIIHGGPTGAFADSYNDWAQLFLSKGYAVMMPNIRGSTGYGWKFLESNRKDWGGGDYKDL
ncbi:MAG TPA: prolyl oligopeptidase family serine peptidase, partial [Puia sp.]|nr:prolyl oligopeptidase family serine peptidase [Puia sp.]